MSMSIGRIGELYWENNIPWQKIKYENDDSGFIASIPGTPSSGLANGFVYSGSNYQNVYYEVNTSLYQRYIPPASEKEFLRQVQEAFLNKGTVSAVNSTQKTVKYIADIHFTNECKIVRVYCSRNCLYWAIVKGENLSYAPLFFEALQITK